MLDAALAAQLKTHFEKITRPVELVASLDDSPKSPRARRRCSTSSPRCPTASPSSARDDDDRRPSFAIRRAGTDVAVRFAGIPLGHELTSLVLALLQVGGHPSTASPRPSSRSRTSRATSPSRPTSR